jgi:hypothetical protein
VTVGEIVQLLGQRKGGGRIVKRRQLIVAGGLLALPERGLRRAGEARVDDGACDALFGQFEVRLSQKVSSRVSFARPRFREA